MSKVADFDPPHLHLAPPCSNFIKSSRGKNESCNSDYAPFPWLYATSLGLCDVLRAVDDMRDLIENEVIGDRHVDEPYRVWFTTTSASADATSYDLLPYDVHPSRELPPVPGDDVATSSNAMSDVLSNSPQRNSGISINTRESAPYFGPGSPTVEPSRDLGNYINVIESDDYNNNDSDNGVASSIVLDDPQYDSAVASTPPAPGVYASLNRRGYYNTGRDNADSGEASGTVCDETHTDYGISSNGDPAAATTTTSYSELAPSSREPLPVPGVYDRLSKHSYYNTDDADNREASDMICDDTQSDTESLLSGRPVSEMEAVL